MPTKQRETYRRQSAPNRNYSYRNEYRAAAPSRYDNRYQEQRRVNNQRDARAAQTYSRPRYDYNAQTADSRRYSGSSYNGAGAYDRYGYDRGAGYSAPVRPYRERDPRGSDYAAPRYGTYTDYTRTAPPRREYGDLTRERRYETREAQPERRVLTREQREERSKKVRSRLKIIGLILVLSFMSLVMIYRQTAIFGKSRDIESLNTTLSEILVKNEGIQSSIDRSIELGNLETYAKNRLGMINPDSSQVFYVDMGAKDEVVKSSSSK